MSQPVNAESEAQRNYLAEALKIIHNEPAIDGTHLKWAPQREHLLALEERYRAVVMSAIRIDALHKALKLNRFPALIPNPFLNTAFHDALEILSDAIEAIRERA